MRKEWQMRSIMTGCAALFATCVALGTAAAEPRLPSRRIDVAFHDADIRNVLRFFAEVGDVNIVYGEGVDGRVTLELHRVRWDTALRAILRTVGLEMEVQDNIILVASQESFSRERQAEVDVVQHCLATDPLRTRIIRVSYARAADVAPFVEATLTERGTVTVDERTNSLIVRDVDCPR
jgi:type IV pilus assembly protein PilQ